MNEGSGRMNGSLNICMLYPVGPGMPNFLCPANVCPEKGMSESGIAVWRPMDFPVGHLPIVGRYQSIY
jgi:hypothetical protein